MNTEEKLEVRLIGRIERSMYEGGGTFSKKYILGGVNGEEKVAKKCIYKWREMGKLVILKDISIASDDDLIIQMKEYIQKPIPWP